MTVARKMSAAASIRENTREDAVGPPPPDTHPDPQIYFSTSNTRSEPLTLLHGAELTVPVSIFLLPNSQYFKRAQFFIDPSSTVTFVTQAEELADVSFIRGDSVAFFDMLGGNPNANMWTLDNDPSRTGGRVSFGTDGEHTLKVQITYLDDTTAIFLATFTININPDLPTQPDVPTGFAIDVSTPNQAIFTWDDMPDADSYEERHGELTAGDSVWTAAVSPLTLNIPEGNYYGQIRSINNSMDFPSNPAELNFTVTGESTSDIPPTTRWNTIFGGYGTGRLRTHCTTAGPPYPGVPQPWAKIDINRDGADSAFKLICGNSANGNALEEAWSKWNLATNIHPSVQDGLGRHINGPGVTITLPCSWGNVGNAKNMPSASPLNKRNNYKSYQGFLAILNGDYDQLYRDIANGIKNFIIPGSGQTPGYWVPRVIIRLGHEHNLPAFPWFSGVDPNLIGTISALLDPDGIGCRGRTFAAVITHIITIFRDADPRFIFENNLAHPGADATEAPGDLARTWFPAGYTLETMPSYPEGDLFDSIGMDVYCRSGGRASDHPDSLPVNPLDWADMTTYLHQHKELGLLKNRPLSFPEVGVCPHNTLTLTGATVIPGPIGNYYSQTGALDSVAADWINNVYEWIDRQILAYALLWYPTRIDYASNDGYSYQPHSGTRKLPKDSAGVQITLPESGRDYIDGRPLTNAALRGFFPL